MIKLLINWRLLERTYLSGKPSTTTMFLYKASLSL
nr:MAG TPA: hypothetical protein [Caudoviricetes sp.]